MEGYKIRGLPCREIRHHSHKLPLLFCLVGVCELIIQLAIHLHHHFENVVHNCHDIPVVVCVCEKR